MSEIKLTISGICERCVVHQEGGVRQASGLVKNDSNTTPAFIAVCSSCKRDDEELITEFKPDGFNLITNKIEV